MTKQKFSTKSIIVTAEELHWLKSHHFMITEGKDWTQNEVIGSYAMAEIKERVIHAYNTGTLEDLIRTWLPEEHK